MSGTSPPQVPGNGDELSAADMLAQMRALRRQASSISRAYWLPLLLFGMLICGSMPFYVEPRMVRGVAVYTSAGWQSPYFGGGGLTGSAWLSVYWFIALQAGIAASALWYRWRGYRVGLRTPARGLVVAGVVLIELAILASIIGGRTGYALPGDLTIRGTVPLVLIAVPLWVLAWAERSTALAVIVACYTGLALLASLYDVENIFFRLGWNPSSFGWRLAGLPNVALPALLLLLAGAGAWLAPRLRWRSRRPASA